MTSASGRPSSPARTFSNGSGSSPCSSEARLSSSAVPRTWVAPGAGSDAARPRVGSSGWRLSCAEARLRSPRRAAGRGPGRGNATGGRWPAPRPPRRPAPGRFRPPAAQGGVPAVGAARRWRGWPPPCPPDAGTGLVLSAASRLDPRPGVAAGADVGNDPAIGHPALGLPWGGAGGRPSAARRASGARPEQAASRIAFTFSYARRAPGQALVELLEHHRAQAGGEIVRAEQRDKAFTATSGRSGLGRRRSMPRALEAAAAARRAGPAGAGTGGRQLGDLLAGQVDLQLRLRHQGQRTLARLRLVRRLLPALELLLDGLAEAVANSSARWLRAITATRSPAPRRSRARPARPGAPVPRSLQNRTTRRPVRSPPCRASGHAQGVLRTSRPGGNLSERHEVSFGGQCTF